MAKNRPLQQVKFTEAKREKEDKQTRKRSKSKKKKAKVVMKRRMRRGEASAYHVTSRSNRSD